MVMTDPIADMLTRVRNANTSKKDVITLPASNVKQHIAEILASEGYVGEVSTAGLREWAVESDQGLLVFAETTRQH